jgi:hypothetical protein
VSKLCNRPTKLIFFKFYFILSHLIYRISLRYGKYLVPDGMLISEIYDSEAQSIFFTDANQYVTYLSSSYGVAVTNEELE